VGETLGDGQAGLLVAPNDVEALSAGMQRVAEDADLRARLIEGGRERVRALEPGVIAGQWLELIERLRGSRR
jgi:glycosyltransferase involved in cell wall biosynthesis